VAWTPRDNVHVTLKFLGGVETPRLDSIAAALGAAVRDVKGFEIAVEGLGAFPSRTRARVLWAGIGAGAPQLATVAGRVEQALEPFGFPRETRPFAAHVTLGRVREPRASPRLASALEAPAAFGRQPVVRVSLMRSELSPRGARYTELAALPLAD
jgi:2'-5' RNA ligase